MSQHSVEVILYEFDVLNLSDHLKLINELKYLPCTIISTIGLLGNQVESELNPTKAIDVIKSNFEGPALILLRFAKKFEERGYGTLVGAATGNAAKRMTKNCISRKNTAHE